MSTRESTEEKAKFGLKHRKKIQLLLANLDDLIHERVWKVKTLICCYSRYVNRIMKKFNYWYLYCLQSLPLFSSLVLYNFKVAIQKVESRFDLMCLAVQLIGFPVETETDTASLEFSSINMSVAQYKLYSRIVLKKSLSIDTDGYRNRFLSKSFQSVLYE